MCRDSPETKEPAEFPLQLHEPGVPGMDTVGHTLPPADLCPQLQLPCCSRLLIQLCVRLCEYQDFQPQPWDPGMQLSQQAHACEVHVNGGKISWAQRRSLLKFHWQWLPTNIKYPTVWIFLNTSARLIFQQTFYSGFLNYLGTHDYFSSLLHGGEKAWITHRGFPYFFWLSPTLQDEYMSIDIFNTDPAGKTESGISPNPVHYCSQLSQKGN